MLPKITHTAQRAGKYDTVGEFTMHGTTNKNKQLLVTTIIKGLMDPATNVQVKVSAEYSSKFQYYEHIVPILKSIQQQNQLFDAWKGKLLYPWQFRVLRLLMNQSDRSLMWITDPAGNSGKSFLAKYLRIGGSCTILPF